LCFVKKMSPFSTSDGTFDNSIVVQKQKNGLRILRFDILRVPPIQIQTKECKTPSFVDQILLQNKLKAFHITNMCQVYTHPTSASDFFSNKLLKS
jgi:hypothetical protein